MPASAWCSSSSSRPRAAPNCSSRCGCRKAPRSARPTPPRRRRKACWRGSRHRHLYELCGAGRAALLARAQSRAAERQLRPDRHRHQRSRSARARQGADRKGARRWLPAGRTHPRRSFRVRPAGRVSGAVSRDRARCAEGARDRRRRAQGDGGKPKLIDPHLDWGEQAKSIRLEVDQDRARAIGLTPQDVAQTLQTLLSGFTVTQYREGIESIDVVARARRPSGSTSAGCRA